MLKHFLFLDWLRILATIAVITVHISTGFVLANYNDSPATWLAGNFYESVARWCVPIFIMISGALLLSDSRESTYRTFFAKRASKVFVPLLGWSAIYYLYFVSRDRYPAGLLDFITRFSTNDISNHLWFIYMLLGMYLITPLLKLLLKNAQKKDVTYFLALWLYISVAVRLLKHYVGFSFEIELYFATSYIGYYVLGYYLITYEISSLMRKLAYAGTVVGIAGTFFLTYSFTMQANGAFRAFWYDYHSPTVLLSSIGIFVFLKHLPISEGAIKHFVPAIINNTNFGIYLVHMLVISLLSTFAPFLWLDMSAFLEIPYKVLLTLIGSIIIVLVMRKIPLIKKLVP